jgi:hypothetical protein
MRLWFLDNKPPGHLELVCVQIRDSAQSAKDAAGMNEEHTFAWGRFYFWQQGMGSGKGLEEIRRVLQSGEKSVK